MSKHNFLNKKIKKQILSINDLIESSFNKLKYFIKNYRKILFNKDNRLVLVVGIVVILTLSYLLIPTLFDKGVIETKIKNQIYKKYNVDIKFNEKINYGLLPKPHFSTKNVSILRNKKEIGSTKKLTAYISLNQLISIKKIDIKNLVFNKTDFNIYFDDLVFFENLLKTEPNENKIFFKKSNIFFKNKNEEILFINKINNSEFYYDPKKLQNILLSKNEIFNIPYKLTIRNDKFNKTFYTISNFNKIKLRINSENSYDKEIIEGFFDILFVNKKTSVNYKLKKDSLIFSSENNKNFYDGVIDFKPFYFSANFNYEGLSTKNLFREDSILIDLINSEILNNKNFSANLNLNVKKITNINELKNISLKVSIEEGNIKFSDSKLMWKDDVQISLIESLLTLDDDGINLIGSLLLNFKDINDFYSSFQIERKNRKDVKQVKIDFVYNLDTKSFRFDNSKIDNIQNDDVEEFLNRFNSKTNREFNKITFKNFISNFFDVYAG